MTTQKEWEEYHAKNEAWWNSLSQQQKDNVNAHVKAKADARELEGARQNISNHSGYFMRNFTENDMGR